MITRLKSTSPSSIYNKIISILELLKKHSHIQNSMGWSSWLLLQFKVDRLQIILVAKKYIYTCRNCSSVGCLKCVQFHNWFRLHQILYQLQNILGGATHHVLFNTIYWGAGYSLLVVAVTLQNVAKVTKKMWFISVLTWEVPPLKWQAWSCKVWQEPFSILFVFFLLTMILINASLNAKSEIKEKRHSTTLL